MRTTTEWLDLAKAKHSLTDYALAPKLGVGRGQISKYRTGKDFLSDDAALKLAALLEMDNPAPIIASAHAERAKTSESRMFWERFAGLAATVVMAVGASAAPSPQGAQAATQLKQNVTGSLYIMLNQGGVRTVLSGPLATEDRIRSTKTLPHRASAAS
ncbi:DUF3693 domain-containing protein [Variovorax sp. UMC13]|uniref:DUF3693 domain-containing protein n=1 Tax=Variovorax sp. UMC13 TaxID=1862326 RepID=UPI0015FF9B20|nr:DUF3693 domain-containing protein [Variovorax sp. UMC13]MBB1602533.1 hypothetical protein [Variovorax sp. UMC13]